MRQISYTKLNILIAILLLAGSCASRQPQTETVVASTKKVIDIKADSYLFEPSDIRLNQGDSVVLNIKNVSGIEHNFTIRGPNGKVLQTVELRPLKSNQVRITFSEKGVYNFSCDLPLHPELGMKGRIVVSAAV